MHWILIWTNSFRKFMFLFSLSRDDGHRVFHTDGGNLIVTGSKDRKLRFIEMENRAELDLKISGHAGSIKCVHLNEEENYVLSGSYDTSIRYVIILFIH